MRPSLLACVWIAATVVGCHAGPPPAAPSPRPSESDRAWDDLVRGGRTIDGFVPLVLGADGVAYLELSPAQLGKDFGLAVTLTHAFGANFMVQGSELGPPLLMQLRRVGHKVYVISRDPRLAHGSDPATTAMARDSGDAIVAALTITSERDGKLLVDASDWLLGDSLRVRDLVGQTFGGPAAADSTATVDRGRSFVEDARGFPRNVELDTTMTFVPDKPRFPRPVAGAVDNRSITLGLRWSLYALPDAPMSPRAGDDRVGYFDSPSKDLTRLDVAIADPTTSVIHRWRLTKQDPRAALSPPVTPITYYLDASVPPAYRPRVRDAVLEWNKAFEASGYKDAIRVLDAPPGLDYHDQRYSTIHWVSTWDLPFLAEGQHEIDPRTGEILKADIIIVADALTAFGRNARETPRGACAAGSVAGTQILLGALVAAARPGTLDPKLVRDEYLRWMVTHEVGHTLGLRHNFRGSSATPDARLQDRAYTAKHGLSASVMDYPGLNVAEVGVPQGELAQQGLGDYDYVAIAYGYGAADDRAALGAIAQQVDAIGYGNDEENWIGAWAVDPKTAGGDLGDDPVASARRAALLVDEVLPHLADTEIDQGEPYTLVRRRLVELMGFRTGILDNAVRVVGGIDAHHRHRGDAGGPPMLPIPAAEQRRALTAVLDLAFGAHAFAVPPSLVPMLPPSIVEEQSPYEYGWHVPVDLPVHALVAQQQDATLRSLLAPQRLARILDNTLRVPAGQAFTLGELFATTTKALFTELDAGPRVVTSERRAVQRAYVSRLLGLARVAEAPPAMPDVMFGDPATPSPPDPPPPAEARALARSELVALRRKLLPLAHSAGDADTRAHVEDLRALIDRSLDAPPTSIAWP